MNNKNKMKRGKRKREKFSRAKKEELEFFAQEIIENYFFASSKLKDDYIEKSTRLNDEYSIDISFSDNQLKWNVTHEVIDYLNYIFRFEDEEEQKLAITAMVNDIILKVFKKSYKLLIKNLRENNSEELDVFREELFFQGEEGFNIFKRVLMKYNEDDSAKLDHFTKKSKQKFFIEKELLPVYIYQFSKSAYNKRVIRIVEDPENIKNDFNLKYFSDKSSIKDISDRMFGTYSDLNIFLNLLDFKDYDGGGFKSSLNLVIFNQLTHLFDLHILSNSIVLNSINLQFAKYLTGTEDELVDQETLFLESKSYYLKLYKLGLGIKEYILTHSSCLIDLNESKIKMYKKIEKKIRAVFEKKLISCLEIESEVPSLIKNEYLIYKKLKGYEEYKQEILNNLKTLKPYIDNDNKASTDRNTVLSYLAAYKTIYNLYKDGK